MDKKVIGRASTPEQKRDELIQPVEDLFKVTEPIDDKKFDHAFKACSTESPCSEHGD